MRRRGTLRPTNAPSTASGANPPHINVDAHPLVDPHFSGVGHYTAGIVRGFDELAGEGKLTYSLVVPPGPDERLAGHGLQWYDRKRHPVPLGVLHRRFGRGFMPPYDLTLGRGSVLFPSFLAYPTIHRSSVVIHDVTYLDVPECVEPGNRELLERAVPLSLQTATNVLVNSEFTKAEVVRHYGTDPDRILVATPAVERRLFYRRTPEQVARVKAKYGIMADGYLLSVGNFEPRKNQVRLIDAYCRLPRSVTDRYALVLVGSGAWNDTEIQERLIQARLAGYRIYNPGHFVSDDDLPALYTGAQFYVFVPIYEGFGMSPLEAYACGTPVLASDVASVPEAAGPAAVYTSPFDTDGLVDALATMVQRTEDDRDGFRSAMAEHLARFSWRRSAEIAASALTGHPVASFGRAPCRELAS